MKEIAVTDEQYASIDGLREALKTEHVGRYGHVRMQDAVQYLVDTHASVTDEGEDLPVRPVGAKATGTNADDESGSEDRQTDDADADGGTAGSDEDDVESEDRLSAMMNLLDTHTEKWGETPSEQGRYEVKLPDGDLEVVQTKDDVRAVLFKNYR